MVLRFLALALVLLQGIASAQTLEQKLDALKEFRKFFPRFKETPDKVEAIHGLKLSDCAETAEELLKILREKEPEVRDAAKKVLSGFTDQATFSPLIADLPKTTDPVRRATIIEVLGIARQTSAVSALSQLVGAQGQPVEVRYFLLRTLALLDAKSEGKKLVPYLKDPEYVVRIAACDTLGQFREKEAGVPMVPLLKDPMFQVKAAAIKAVGLIRVQEAVEPLIDILGEEGRFKIEAADALYEITDSDYGTDQAMWKKTWTNLKGMGFKIPSDEELAKARANRKKAAEQYKRAPTTAKTYHHVPIVSKQVLFVIDVSGSMADLVVEREKFKQAGFTSFEKLEIVKTELENTIKNLDDNTNFNILAFATKVKRWKDWLVPANITNRAAAISFVKGLRPLGAREDPMGGAGAPDEGKTNTFGALMAAFELDPSKDAVITGGKEAPKNKLDTIFFLSDGRPSTGKYVDTTEILGEVKKVNATRRIVLHAIAIGEFQKEFLKQLAEDNGGKFVDLGN